MNLQNFDPGWNDVSIAQGSFPSEGMVCYIAQLVELLCNINKLYKMLLCED